MLLRALLLLEAMIGWSAAARRGQDSVVHFSDQTAHDVGAAQVRVVHRSWFATCLTGVIVINITTMGVKVVLILPMFEESGRTNYLLLAADHTAKTHGWLVVVGNHGHCSDRHHFICYDW
jgi:hypothetical protein